MSKYDIIVTFFTIIYGLMITELFLNFHRIISVRKNVKWHWMTLISAWYLFLTVLRNWYGLLNGPEDISWMNIFFFIAYGHLLLLIYLSVSTVFPSAKGNEQINLEEYYFSNHRYFWGLVTCYSILSLLIPLFRNSDQFSEVGMLQLIGTGLFLFLTLLLTFSGNNKIHAIGLVVLNLGLILDVVSASS